jgi:hypothetical protein
MNSRTIPVVLALIVVIVLLVLGLRYVLGTNTGDTTATTTPNGMATTTPVDLSTIRSFEDCERAGYPVQESSPRQCRLPDGRVYAEEIVVTPTYKNASSDMIRVSNPPPGAVTGKSFKVTGEARGNWYFEASFPITVLDRNGKVLATAVAQAQGDWMTTNFVPFSVDIAVPQSYIGPATLVLQKDNPSGLPQNDASLSIPFTIEY